MQQSDHKIYSESESDHAKRLLRDMVELPVDSRHFQIHNGRIFASKVVADKLGITRQWPQHGDVVWVLESNGRIKTRHYVFEDDKRFILDVLMRGKGFPTREEAAKADKIVHQPTKYGKAFNF